MSSDETPNVPTPRNSREVVREKAQQVHAQQSRARLMRRIIIGAVAIVAVGAIGTAVTLAVSAQVTKPQLTPTGMEDDGILITDITASASSDEVPATPSAEPTDAATEPTATPEPTAVAGAVDIHIYVDYLSPDAGTFERANARQLANWITEGAATVTYHPVALLTASSNGTKYSLRAASAAACVATYAPASFFGFNDDLLQRQPAVDSDGFSDKELADIALARGGGDDPKKLRECIETQAFASWVKAATERAVAGIDGTDGVALDSTSMVTVNDQKYMGEMTDPAEFSQFVLTTASGKASKSQAATPSPTPTASVTP